MALLNKIDLTASRHAPRHDDASGLEFPAGSQLFADAENIGPTPFAARDEELTVVLPSLALGGAERIVLDWILRLRGRRGVHLVALRTAVHEYAVPAHVRLTRCHASIDSDLRDLGQTLSRAGNRLVLCHLLTGAQRAVLRAAGAHPVAVLHNLRAGWIDAPEELLTESHLIVDWSVFGSTSRFRGRFSPSAFARMSARWRTGSRGGRSRTLRRPCSSIW